MTDQRRPGTPTGQGWLRLNLQKPLGGIGALKPVVHLDDRLMDPAALGIPIAVAEGRHRVEVLPPFRYTRLVCEVDVVEGRVTELWYAPPFARTSRGSLGTAPQPDHAVRFLLVVGAIIVVGLLVTYLR